MRTEGSDQVPTDYLNTHLGAVVRCVVGGIILHHCISVARPLIFGGISGEGVGDRHSSGSCSCQRVRYASPPRLERLSHWWIVSCPVGSMRLKMAVCSPCVT